MKMGLNEIKNYKIKMAETSLQQCLSALCNAGNSVNLRSLGDHFRYLKVSMMWVREVRRKGSTYTYWRECTVIAAWTLLAMGGYIDGLIIWDRSIRFNID